MAKGSDTLIRVLCVIVFAVFSFVYLYCYQSDLLTATQFLLSKGQTHYNHIIGAVLITFLLLLLEEGISRLFREVGQIFVLRFVPSALILTLLTSIRITDDSDYTFGAGLYIVPVLFVVSLALLWFLNSGLRSKILIASQWSFARVFWINMLGMAFVLFLVCCSSDSDKVLHARLHVEQCLVDGNVNEALNEIEKNDIPDSNMTMLTAYVLSRKGELAERLFEFPLYGASSALLPNPAKKVSTVFFPQDSIYDNLGVRFKQKMPPMEYLSFMNKHRVGSKISTDYLLCGYLLDRDLDAFVNELGKHYAVNDSLPKHYREALTLYVHLHSAPRIMYRNSVMEADFQDFQDMEKTFQNKIERKNQLRSTYGDTYWYYYQYAPSI